MKTFLISLFTFLCSFNIIAQEKKSIKSIHEWMDKGTISSTTYEFNRNGLLSYRRDFLSLNSEIVVEHYFFWEGDKLKSEYAKRNGQIDCRWRIDGTVFWDNVNNYIVYDSIKQIVDTLRIVVTAGYLDSIAAPIKFPIAEKLLSVKRNAAGDWVQAKLVVDLGLGTGYGNPISVEEKECTMKTNPKTLH